MTASTSNNFAAAAPGDVPGGPFTLAAGSYRVPGVYFAPQPRAPRVDLARTDVAGFIGFEPRLRDADPPSRLTGPGGAVPAPGAPIGHDFAVDVSAFFVAVGTSRVAVPATPRLSLSKDAGLIPVADGQGIVYAVAVGAKRGVAGLIVATGLPDAGGSEQAPGDDDLAAAVAMAFQGQGDAPGVAAARRWARLADVHVRRRGAAVSLTVLPALVLRVTRCDDWRDYLALLGTPRDDGTVLGPAVRAFFANGGGRCYVTTVRRPGFDDDAGLELARQEMIGIQGSSEIEATGLERLLLVDEVSVVDAPDLYARRTDPGTRTVTLPPPDADACFRPCPRLLPDAVVKVASGDVAMGDPLFPWLPSLPFPQGPLIDAQWRMISRCVPERWRVLLLLAPPLTLDGGSYGPPTVRDVAAWRDVFDDQQKNAGLGDADSVSCFALYYPWALIQEQAGATVYNLPPTALAAGVIARRDLARGPAVAPANETLSTVVAVSPPITEDDHGRLYSPDPDVNGLDVPAVNVLRPFPGYGVQLWGARTFSTDTWLRYVNVRRGLSAVERRCKAALDTMVFEPNTPLLWAQVTQVVLGVLLPMFESGVLRGDQPDQAFYVRCDGSVNTPESVDEGMLLCEVGVAIAAPAEFIVFRLGRREGVVEVVE